MLIFSAWLLVAPVVTTAVVYFIDLVVRLAMLTDLEQRSRVLISFSVRPRRLSDFIA
jgi:hypothetical protein